MRYVTVLELVYQKVMSSTLKNLITPIWIYVVPLSNLDDCFPSSQSLHVYSPDVKSVNLIYIVNSHPNNLSFQDLLVFNSSKLLKPLCLVIQLILKHMKDDKQE